MVLSTGTLNLKFMQRAAARQAQTSTPGAASPRPSSTLTSTLEAPPTPTPGPSSSKDLSAVEQAALAEQWVLPSRHKGKGKERDFGGQVTFERSYMGFIGSAVSSTETGSTRSGGGRITFGFGEEKANEGQEDQEGKEDHSEDEDDDEHRAMLDEVMQDRPSRTFIKPRGFDSDKIDYKQPFPDSTSAQPALQVTVGPDNSTRQKSRIRGGGGGAQATYGKTKRERPEEASDDHSENVTLHTPPAIRATGSGSKADDESSRKVDFTSPVPVSQNPGKPVLEVTVGVKAAAQTSKKRKHTGASSSNMPEGNPKPSNGKANERASKTAPSGATSATAGLTEVAKGFKGPENGALDERERAIKAQKKKDKKAKKKAQG